MKKHLLENLFKKIIMSDYQKTGQKPFTFLNMLLEVILPILFVGIGCADYEHIVLWIVVAVLVFISNIALLVFRFRSPGLVIKYVLLDPVFCVYIAMRMVFLPFLMSIIMFAPASVSLATGGGFSMPKMKIKIGTSSLNLLKYEGSQMDDVYTETEGSEPVGENYTVFEEMGAQSMGYFNADEAVQHGVERQDLEKEYLKQYDNN